MKQEPQKEAVVPEPSAAPPPKEPPRPALQPEDEALVAERLRELGYIE
jgi:hypothetical protein